MKSIWLILAIGIFLIGMVSAQPTINLLSPLNNSIIYNFPFNLSCSAQAEAGKALSNISVLLDGSINRTILFNNSVENPTYSGWVITTNGYNTGTGKYGGKITTGTSYLRITGFTKFGNSLSTKAYILDSSKNILATATYSGNNATFSGGYVLSPETTYYFAGDAEGALVAHVRDTGICYPYSLGESDFTLVGDLKDNVDNVDSNCAFNMNGHEFNSISQAIHYNVIVSTSQNNWTLNDSIGGITGSHTWTCKATQNNSVSSIAGIFNIQSDSTLPTIDLSQMNRTIDYQVLGNNITFNWTVSDTNLANCSIAYQGNIYYPVCSDGNISLNISDYNSVSLNFSANDTLGNTASQNVSWNYKLFQNSINYNQSTISTSIESFLLNLSYLSSNWINVQATLFYNNSSYTSSKLGSGDNIYFLNSFNVPNALTKTNYTFYWKIALTNYSGTFYFNSSQYQQIVNPIQNISIITGGSACPTGFSQSLYFNFADEENLTYLNSSGSYNIQYGIGNNSALLLAGTYSNVQSISFCMNSSFSYYSLRHGEINYGANGYINRFFYLFENSRITNQTINNTLYLLPNTATTTSFLFDFQDSTLFPLSERYATLMRWYPGFNEYRVVEMGKTDDKGETIMRVKSEDTDYRVGIYYLNGTLVKLLNPIRFACLSSPCTYSTIVQDTTANYVNYFNVQTGLTYNETTHIWSFIWNDPSQDTKSMRLVVSRERGDSSYVICNNTASGFTGILTCDSSGYTGNLEAVVYRSASPEVPIAQLLITTGTTPLSNSIGLFVSLIIFLLLALIGIWSPIASIVLGLVALIPAYFFGTITLPILIAIGVLAGVIIHFMKRSG